VARPRQAGLDVFQRLCEHDSAPVRVRLGDAVITGNTGTNLCDLNVICDTGENGR
jgi:glycerate-2-kinase